MKTANVAILIRYQKGCYLSKIRLDTEKLYIVHLFSFFNFKTSRTLASLSPFGMLTS